jgi:hypothetical protein
MLSVELDDRTQVTASAVVANRLVTEVDSSKASAATSTDTLRTDELTITPQQSNCLTNGNLEAATCGALPVLRPYSARTRPAPARDRRVTRRGS